MRTIYNPIWHGHKPPDKTIVQKPIAKVTVATENTTTNTESENK